MSKYDKVAGTRVGSEKATDSDKLLSLQAYLTRFSGVLKPHEITECYLGIGAPADVKASRNGGRLPALQNADKLAVEAPIIAKNLAGSSQRTIDGVVADVDARIASLTAFRKEIAAVKSSTPVTVAAKS